MSQPRGRLVHWGAGTAHTLLVIYSLEWDADRRGWATHARFSFQSQQSNLYLPPPQAKNDWRASEARDVSARIAPLPMQEIITRGKSISSLSQHTPLPPQEKNPLKFHTSCPQRVSAARQTQTKPVPKRSLEVAVTKVCYLEAQLHLPIDMHERQLLFPQKGGI